MTRAITTPASVAAIAVRLLGTGVPTEQGAPAGVAAAGFTVTAGYTHPTPGAPPSHICGYVTGPANTVTTVTGDFAAESLRPTAKPSNCDAANLGSAAGDERPFA